MSKIPVYVFLLIITSFAIIFACREDLDFENASKNLHFSENQVMLDTVFTNYNSDTYTLKVYNQEDKDVIIQEIGLQLGNSSLYRLNIDGRATNQTENIPIRAKDSLFIFIEMAVTNFNADFIYEDKILFKTNAGTQEVPIISFVEAAEYIVQQPNTDAFEITTNTTWDNTKAKVVFGKLKITNNSTLTINQGTKVYFHDRSSLTVDKNASLVTNGTITEPVTFRSDRHSVRFDSLSGLWEGLVLDTLSSTNLNNTKIKSARIGLLALDNSTITINNTEVLNNSIIGLSFFNSNLVAKNLIVNQSGNASLAIQRGGNYDINHSSIVNYSDSGIGLPMYVSNRDGDNIVSTLNSCKVTNSIIYGNSENSIRFFFNTIMSSNYNFDNNLIKNEDINSYNYSADINFTNNTLNSAPIFVNIFSANSNLKLVLGSPGIDIGNSTYSALVPTDFFGNNRLSNSDLGAIESQ